MDGSDNWLGGLEWTSVEPMSRSFYQSFDDFLLPDEEIIAEGRGVLLVNMDITGTLLVTNYRVMFVSEGQRKLIPIGTIPLATIEKFSKQPARLSQVARTREKAISRRLLQVVGKDMRIILFGFQPRTKQRRAIYDALLRGVRPARLWDLYAFKSSSNIFRNTDPKLRLHAEYLRLLHPSGTVNGYGMGPTDVTKYWRISDVNSNFTFSPTYPPLLIVPSSVSDEELQQASTFRARARLPVMTWRHAKNGAVLARSSQPLVGLMLNNRSNADERLVEALCVASPNPEERRKVYIADARPRKNALANGAMGGGSESSSNYFQSEIVFLGIENIHAMRDSLTQLREYLDTHGAAPSDGSSSLLRSGGLAWGGGNLSNMSAAVSALGDSGWLVHVHNVLAAAAFVAARISLEGASVLVHCSDGWDRTTQIVALAELMLDPYYRTFNGFQALVEKDWLAFGHPFADRLGTPLYTSTSSLFSSESLRQNTVNLGTASPVKLGQANFSASASAQQGTSNNYSPIFLQWVDCVAQLLRLYPRAFEFSAAFLVEMLDSVLSCRFGNFLCNSEKERVQAGIADSCGCMWIYLEKQRSARGRDHEHFNIFYDRENQNGPLLPPAAALAPMLWPNFFLRWACPTEENIEGSVSSGWVQGAELENYCRALAISYADLKRAKERAEMKVRELNSRLKRMSEELRVEKQTSSSAIVSSSCLQKENLAIKRALQAMGCKVRFSDSADILNSNSSDEESTTKDGVKFMSPRNIEDLAISVSIVPDTDLSANIFRRTCGEICEFGDEEGCGWPASNCARMGSGFLGVRANFDALERLSIVDCYFESEEAKEDSDGSVPGVT